MIGIFDSGVGGLGIYKHIERRLPHKSFLYVADTANCPYSLRSDREVREFTRRAVGYLVGQGVTLVVIACNTATVSGIDYIRSWYNVPVVGVVPVIKTAAALSLNKKIGVIGTPITVNSPYQRKLAETFASEYQVFSAASPKLVELIESGSPDREALVEETKKSIQPLLNRGIDTLVLACTHYTLIRDIFEEVAGPRVLILDSNEPVARQVEKLVHEHGLFAGEHERYKRFAVTGNPQQFFNTLRHLEEGSPMVEKVVL